MVASYEDGKHWCFLGSTVVLIERLHVAILDRCCHAVEVSTVTHCLYGDRYMYMHVHVDTDMHVHVETDMQGLYKAKLCSNSQENYRFVQTHRLKRDTKDTARAEQERSRHYMYHGGNKAGQDTN